MGTKPPSHPSRLFAFFAVKKIRPPALTAKKAAPPEGSAALKRIRKDFSITWSEPKRSS